MAGDGLQTSIYPGHEVGHPVENPLHPHLGQAFKSRGNHWTTIEGAGDFRLGACDISLAPANHGVTTASCRGAFRSDTSYQGLTKIEAFDGVQGWVLDPFAGEGPAAKAQPMTPAQFKQAALLMDFDSPLVDAPAKGHRITLEGRAKVGSSEAYVLRVDLGTGNVLRSYLDTITFVEIKVTNMAVNEGQEIEVEALLGDYRPVAGGMLPFVLVIRPKGQP